MNLPSVIIQPKPHQYLSKLLCLANLAIVLSLSALVNLTTAIARADDSPSVIDTRQSLANGAGQGSIQDVQLGIGGLYKLGRWVPVSLTITSPMNIENGWLAAEASDPEGIGCVYQTQLPKIIAGVPTRAQILCKLGARQGKVQLRVADERGEVARTDYALNENPAVPTGQQIVIAMGGEIGAEQALARRLGPPSDRVAYYRATTLGNLPLNFLGYDSVDAIVVGTGNLAWLDSVSPDQWMALRNWVQQGGKMIATFGANSDAMLSPDKPLAWFTPGEFLGTTTLRQTTGIEQFAGARRIETATGLAGGIAVAEIRPARGVVEATEGYGDNRLATIVRFASGMGQGIFVGYDLDQEPFAQWKDREKLAGQLLERVLSPVNKGQREQSDIGPVAHLGFDDLAGQLRRALDRFPGVKNISFGWVAGLTVLYLLLIGPLDYWLIRRLDRPSLTWFTFASYVVGFTAIAVYLVSTWKGNTLQASQVALVDASLETSEVRGTTWAHIYSPQSTRVSIDLDLSDIPTPRTTPPTQPHGQAVSWQGLPGAGFGGLERSDKSASFHDPYQITPAGSIAQFPIATHSSRALIGQWWTTLSDTSRTELFASRDSVVSGQITNPFAADLSDVYVLFDRWAYKLGNIPAAATVTVTERGGIDLQSLLGKREFVNGVNVAEPWHIDGVELDRILQLMSFYDAAKGYDYTQLDHRFEQQIDWSDHLTANYAVLWGRSSHAPVAWRVNGQAVTDRDDTLTYYRLLIPVKRRGV
ncbi:MAG: hypothetical protein KDA92_01855 [Planctomycetales bacterium]|nr:hypothetical protein [Planctomycetales bacterium]